MNIHAETAVGELLAVHEEHGGIHVPIGSSLAQAERWLIEATLAHWAGNKNRAAKTLGCSLKTLYNKLAAYDNSIRVWKHMPEIRSDSFHRQVDQCQRYSWRTITRWCGRACASFWRRIGASPRSVRPPRATRRSISCEPVAGTWSFWTSTCRTAAVWTSCAISARAIRKPRCWC